MNFRNESLIKKSPIYPTHHYAKLNFIKGSLSVCKIQYPSLNGNGFVGGTGFFIKFKKDNNDMKYQYFLMTCEHVIEKKMIDANIFSIDIFYHYENIHKTITLNQERFIKEYKTDYNVDITIIEILKEDDISWVYFLEPDYEMKKNNFDNYLQSKIIIHQFPLSNEQCYSEGKITDVIKDEKKIIYKCSTEKGSSGSPIMKEDSKLVFGVHFHGDYEDGYCGNNNYGYFIIDVINDDERKNYANYYIEENKNEGNLTDREILAKKTESERIYNIDIFRLGLSYDSLLAKLEFNIENIRKKEKYSYFEIINKEKIYKIFKYFDDLIYDIEITETHKEFKIEYKYKDYDFLILKKNKHNNTQKKRYYNKEVYNFEIYINQEKKTILEIVEMAEINNSLQSLDITGENYRFKHMINRYEFNKISTSKYNNLYNDLYNSQIKKKANNIKESPKYKIYNENLENYKLPKKPRHNYVCTANNILNPLSRSFTYQNEDEPNSKGIEHNIQRQRVPIIKRKEDFKIEPLKYNHHYNCNYRKNIDPILNQSILDKKRNYNYMTNLSISNNDNINNSINYNSNSNNSDNLNSNEKSTNDRDSDNICLIY